MDVNTSRMISDLILRPDAFFRKLEEGSESLFTPLLWLFASSIVMSIGMMAATDIHYFTFGIGGVLFLILVALVLLTFYTVLAWIGSSGFFYLTSGLFGGGSGPFRKTLQNIGYGLAPGLILYGLILLLGSLAVAASQIPVMPFGPPSLGNQLISIIGRAGTLIASLWGFILMTHGLRYARNLPFVKAAVLVGVPVVVSLIWLNLQYLGPA